MIMRYFSRLSIILAIFLLSCNNPVETVSETYQVPPEIASIPVGTNYGLRAAEIELPDADGNSLPLSSLRGKVVLVDFWASWCPPCRKENPELVKLYEKYKDTKFEKGNGFTIYSVSLDRSKEAWLKAVEDDKLSWPNQVCDLLGARTQPAIDYGVIAVPTSFLLDQNGVIIGVNLRGEALEETIAGLVPEI